MVLENKYSNNYCLYSIWIFFLGLNLPAFAANPAKTALKTIYVQRDQVRLINESFLYALPLLASGPQGNPSTLLPKGSTLIVGHLESSGQWLYVGLLEQNKWGWVQKTQLENLGPTQIPLAIEIPIPHIPQDQLLQSSSGSALHSAPSDHSEQWADQILLKRLTQK